jgi:hypothetical protein
LVATTEGFEVVLGMMAMLAAVGKAGVTQVENRAALAGKPPTTTKGARLIEAWRSGNRELWAVEDPQAKHRGSREAGLSCLFPSVSSNRASRRRRRDRRPARSGFTKSSMTAIG